MVRVFNDIDDHHNVEDNIAEMIIEEKVTRSTRYYKVCVQLFVNL